MKPSTHMLVLQSTNGTSTFPGASASDAKDYAVTSLRIAAPGMLNATLAHVALVLDNLDAESLEEGAAPVLLDDNLNITVAVCKAGEVSAL